MLYYKLYRTFYSTRHQRCWPILESVSTLPPLHCTENSTILPVLFTKRYTKLYTIQCTVLCMVLYTVSCMRMRLQFRFCHTWVLETLLLLVRYFSNLQEQLVLLINIIIFKNIDLTDHLCWISHLSTVLPQVPCTNNWTVKYIVFNILPYTIFSYLNILVLR